MWTGSKSNNAEQSPKGEPWTRPEKGEVKRPRGKALKVIQPRGGTLISSANPKGGAAEEEEKDKQGFKLIFKMTPYYHEKKIDSYIQQGS